MGTRPGFRQNPSITSPTHYGNWVYSEELLGTGPPPVVSVRAGVPLLRCGLLLVSRKGSSWIHTGTYVGGCLWHAVRRIIATATGEALMPVVREQGQHHQININVRNYAYANHAVVVNQNNYLPCEQLQKCSGDQHYRTTNHQQLPCGAGRSITR